MLLPGPMGWYVDRDSATLAIAVLALLTPLFRWIYEKFLRRGKISFYKSDKINVNYVSEGAMISLNGIYRAVVEPLFVENINVRIIRQQDQSQRSFELRYVRFPIYSATGSSWNFGTAGGFLISPSQPIRYDLLFYDPAVQNAIEPMKSRIEELWSQHVDRTLEAIEAAGVAARPVEQNVPAVANDPQAVAPVHQQVDEEQVFQEFYETEEVQRLRADIDRACHWETGRYLIVMDIKSAEPDRTFPHKWAFELTDNDVRKLRENTEAIIRTWCQVQLPFGALYTARVEYLAP